MIGMEQRMPYLMSKLYRLYYRIMQYLGFRYYTFDISYWRLSLDGYAIWVFKPQVESGCYRELDRMGVSTRCGFYLDGTERK